MFVALRKIWMICDCICGKRLGPYLPEIIPVLERCDELKIDEEVRKKLLEISPATIDRLLAPVRKRYQLRTRSNTKPWTLLKDQIPIRTFSEWDEKRPGFVKILRWIPPSGLKGRKAEIRRRRISLLFRTGYMSSLRNKPLCLKWVEQRKNVAGKLRRYRRIVVLKRHSIASELACLSRSRGRQVSDVGRGAPPRRWVLAWPTALRSL